MRRTPVSYLNCLLWRREHRGSPPSQRGARQAPALQGKSRKNPVEINGGKAGGVRGADKGGGEPTSGVRPRATEAAK